MTRRILFMHYGRDWIRGSGRGMTGLLFEPGCVDDLVTKLELLVTDPQLRRQMGARGRERVERHFSLDAYVNTIQNELRALLSPAVLEGQ